MKRCIYRGKSGVLLCNMEEEKDMEGEGRARRRIYEVAEWKRRMGVFIGLRGKRRGWRQLSME